MGKRDSSFSFSTVRRNKLSRLKLMSGRGRKRAKLVFFLLRSVGVKFNTSLLLAHARKLVADAEVGSTFHRLVSINGKPLSDYLKTLWVIYA